MVARTEEPTRLVVGVTGATGIVYAVRALDILRELGIESHLVVSKSAALTRAYETDLSKDDLEGRADVVHHHTDVGAPLSSGSFQTSGMLIAPTSMRTLGEIASGVTSSLVSRAADVTLKERRPLILLVRESPLNLIHLRNMTAVTEAGATVFPPVPAFYSRPSTIEEIVDHTVGRALDQFGLRTDVFPRWDQDLRDSARRSGPQGEPAGEDA
ncbi:UbiX family flavin prenyltransferase [Streptomyces mayonensis]|uniref:UbiX family flavin prenyltransferase n=1 Tax=Streptomyces mayonensis TaxID=2750816 RepID=UPI001C1DD92A|nr:UbiX family flavin prenyltransferase [Streptomyces sp. A108]MBU6529629.1 UbiX family flavin prenyltransferase [Streptomyces sp. A108]